MLLCIAPAGETIEMIVPYLPSFLMWSVNKITRIRIHMQKDGNEVGAYILPGTVLIDTDPRPFLYKNPIIGSKRKKILAFKLSHGMVARYTVRIAIENSGRRPIKIYSMAEHHGRVNFIPDGL